MKNFKWISFIVLLTTICIGGIGSKTGADPSDPVVRINDNVITRATLDREIRFHNLQSYQNPVKSGNSSQPHNLNQLLETLIERELLVQKAMDKEISITASMIQVRLNRLKKRFSNTKSFDTALLNNGFNEDDIRTFIKQGLMVEFLLEDEVFRRIVVTDQEAMNYYEEHGEEFIQPGTAKVRHILIRVPEGADADARMNAMDKAAMIKQRIENGDLFSVLAIEYSDGPNRFLGGDLGYVGREDLIEPLAATAFSLSSGEISQIIETSLGFHLITVEDTTGSKALSFEDVQKKIRNILENRKRQAAVRQYINTLKKRAEIDKLM
ncbi:MAG: hypothetical protein HKM93_06090 [Desulfobacteraceae bacterium]|nr:hypothetical protein [Desulfobacteraceae bacterium]